MRKTYQIDKQLAAQEFRERASAVMDPLQLAIPLAEVMALVQAEVTNAKEGKE